MFIKVTTNVLMSQMHFWLVDYIHKILITFLADVVEKICARGKRRRKRCTGTEHTGQRRKPLKFQSDPRLPPTEPLYQKFPFGQLSVIIFISDGGIILQPLRLTDQTKQKRIRIGTNEPGSKGLCKVLRRIFDTFGVPIETSSDVSFLQKIPKIL